MQRRFGVLALRLSCLAFALSAGAYDRAKAQTVPLSVKLTLPELSAAPIKTNTKNLDVAVTTTDGAGRNPGQADFAGASPDGQCRAFLNKEIPVTSEELYKGAFGHLAQVVEEGGGVQVFIKNPNRIPTAHIWADINTPWRCVAGAILTVQAAGFATVGFISQVSGTSTKTGDIHPQAVYIELPVAIDPGKPVRSRASGNRIFLTAQNTISWNGLLENQSKFISDIAAVRPAPFERYAEFDAEPDTRYDFVIRLLATVPTQQRSGLGFSIPAQYTSFDGDKGGIDSKSPCAAGGAC